MPAEHLDHLDQFFAVLAANGLTINLSKCTFMVPKLEVLGHIINSASTTPIPQHIQVIIGTRPPGCETAAVLPGDGQLLLPLHTSYCTEIR